MAQFDDNNDRSFRALHLLPQQNISDALPPIKGYILIYRVTLYSINVSYRLTICKYEKKSGHDYAARYVLEWTRLHQSANLSFRLINAWVSFFFKNTCDPTISHSGKTHIIIKQLNGLYLNFQKSMRYISFYYFYQLYMFNFISTTAKIMIRRDEYFFRV